MADFIKDQEVAEVAAALIEKFPNLLGHIQLDRILFTREISRSQKYQPGSCRAVNAPFNLLNPDIMYVVSVYYRAGWDKLSSAQKALLILHQLMHIAPEFDGNLLQHDASDWSFILDNFGANYLFKEVPDVLAEEG